MKVYGRATFTTDINPPEGFVTSREAIEIMGISYRHLWRLRESGRFPGAVKPGRFWFFPKEEVEQYANLGN